MTVWNISTGQHVFHAKEHWSYAVSPDDHWLAFGQPDKSVRLVDLRNPQTVKSFDAEGIPEHMAFSPYGKRLAVCYYGRARVVSIINCETLEMEHRLATGNALYVGWHPDGSRLAVATGSRVQIWNVDDERRIAATGDHLSTVSVCEVLPGGELLQTGCWDGSTRLSEFHNMRQVVALERGVQMLSGPDDTVIGFRNVSDGIELVRVERSPILFSLATDRRPNEFPIAVQFTSKNLAVVMLGTGNAGRELQFWDTSARRLLASTAVDQLSGAAFDRRAQRLTVVHGNEVSSLPVRQVGDSQLEIGPPRSFPLPGRPVKWSWISGDGLTIASIIQGRLHVAQLQDALPESTNGTAKIDRLAEFDLSYPHDHLQLSDNGHWAVTYAWHSRVLCLWDLKQKELAREMQFNTYVSASFTPDSSQLVTSSGDAFRFVDLSTMKPGLTLPRQGCPFPDPIAIDSGGRLAVASLQADELQLVELPSGQVLARLRRPQQDRAMSLSFNPAGTRLLEGFGSNGLNLWDLNALQVELLARRLDPIDHQLSVKPVPHRIESVKLIGMEDWARAKSVVMMTEARARQRLEELKATLRSNPKSLSAANTLAWELCMAPAALRNVDRAVELAESVVRRSNTSTFRNTLAAAFYRQGEFQKAVALLEQNLSASPDRDLPWDLLLLSLSQAALGHSQQAKDNLELTKRFMDIDIGGSSLVPSDDRAALDAFLHEADSAVR